MRILKRGYRADFYCHFGPDNTCLVTPPEHMMDPHSERTPYGVYVNFEKELAQIEHNEEGSDTAYYMGKLSTFMSQKPQTTELTE